MRGLSGLTLVLAGGVAGMYGLYPEAGDRQVLLDNLTRGWGTALVGAPSSGDAETRTVVADPSRRVFSPQTPLFQQPAAPPAGDPARTPVRTVTAPAVAPAAANPSPVRTIETADVAPLGVETKALPAAPATAPLRAIAGKSGDEEAQRELTRSLQKELKRVGCYDGEINGTWSAASKRAMKSFTDRVNATLPIESPDYILLTLVQGHGAEACGATCPGDQAMSSEGRCLPRAIIAQSGKKTGKATGDKGAGEKKLVAQKVARPPEQARKLVPPAASAKAETAASPASASPEVGRAVEMWSKVTKSNGGTSAGAGGGWQTSTAAVAAPLPAQIAPVQQAQASVEPLPGRMAIGGPVPAPTQIAPFAASQSRVQVAATPSPSGNDESQEAVSQATPPVAKPSRQRIPSHAVEVDRPRPARIKPSYNAKPVYIDRPVVTSKSTRVRAMHYKLFNDPTRATN